MEIGLSPSISNTAIILSPPVPSAPSAPTTITGNPLFIFEDGSAESMPHSLDSLNSSTGIVAYTDGGDSTAVKVRILDAPSGTVTYNDKITNGGFVSDTGWTKPSNWSISGGAAISDGSQVADADLAQGATFVNTNTYETTFTITNYSAGNATAVVGDTEGTDRAANGTFIETIIASSGSDFDIRADVDFIGHITLVKCAPIFTVVSNGRNVGVVTLSVGKSVIFYDDNTNSSKGTAQVVDTVLATGEITGNVAFVFEDGSTSLISGSKINVTTMIIAYRDAGNSSFGTTQILDEASGLLTGNTVLVFESASTSEIVVKAISETKAIISFKDQGNSNKGTTEVVTISGGGITGNVSFVFEDGAIKDLHMALLNIDTAILTYKDEGNSNFGTTQIINFVSTTVSGNTVLVFKSEATTGIAVEKIDEDNAIVGYTFSSTNVRSQVLNIINDIITGNVEFDDSTGGNRSLVNLDSSRMLATFARSSKGQAQVLEYS